MNADTEFSLSVSPLRSLFLDTQKSCGHGQPAGGPGKMSMWRCPSHCTWAPPEVLLLQGSSGSPHTVGLSELKSTESYPWVKRGLDFVPPLHPSVTLSLDQHRKEQVLVVVYYTWLLTGRSGNGNQEVPEEARKGTSLMARMKVVFFTFCSSGHFFLGRFLSFEERTCLLALFISNLEKY